MKNNISKKKPLIFLPLVRFTLLSVIAIVGISIVLKSLSYFNPDFNEGYLSDKEDVFIGIFSVGLYVHLLVSPLLLAIGSLQVFRKAKSDRIHQIAGKCYTVGVLFLGGPSGVILAFYATGGIAGKVNFLLLSVLWMFFTYRAYQHITEGDKTNHRVDSISSYVLLLSAILLRINSFVVVNFTSFPISSITYVILSILSWLPSLIATRIFLTQRKSPVCNSTEMYKS